MKSLHCYRRVLAFCTGAVMLAGCGTGSSTPLSPLPAGLTAERAAARPAYKLLRSFEGGSRDGEWPVARLVNVNGTLYGTTRFGGANGYGTVFSITRSGTEKVLYSFKNCPDGSYPEGGLLDVNGTLYGTTVEGGANCGTYGGFGTVFSITLSGTEKVLYSFKNDPDGVYPEADLLNVNGTLYGTASQGGEYHKGTVFSITIHGKEKTLHSFGSSGDGVYPEGALLNVNGTLYGTTYNGGAYSCGSTGNCGTVFSITRSGTETVLYSFKGSPSYEGDHPVAGLVNDKGTLYGTTWGGGTAKGGTVFRITTSGVEKLLHNFNGYDGDGAAPEAPLLNVGGTLYSTTYVGGAFGYGTVYSITPSGAEKVLYSFASDPDGEYPVAGLVDVKGTLYGTTFDGGAYSCGYGFNCGTVFSLSP
jgi:uncharacterized repeat protein (TIGR03803 family)